jgi:hypothetical protein
MTDAGCGFKWSTQYFVTIKQQRWSLNYGVQAWETAGSTTVKPNK